MQLGVQLLARYGGVDEPAAQAQAEVETWVVLEYCGRGELKVLLTWWELIGTPVDCPATAGSDVSA